MGSSIKTIRYVYDSRGNRKALINHEGERTTYVYDKVNRLTSVENPQNERTSYSYDDAGRRTVKEMANGTRASFSYDPAGNLTGLSNLKSGGTVISSFEYEYDKVGNRTSVLEADGSRVTWSYDNTYQITGEHRSGSSPYQDTYTYDPSGNRLLKIHDGARTTYVYDAANQLTYSQDVSGRTTYTFDADGNQQVVRAPSGDRTTYVWDYENRMTSVRLPSGIRNTMAYDADGLRMKLEESTGTKKFVWDDQNYLAETDENNDTQVVYTNEPRRYGNLISQRRGSDSHWFHFDAIGSTRELTDGSAVITDTRLYDAWGNVLSASGSTGPSLCYVGELGYVLDPATGQLYVRQRLYRPAIGRWLSTDPLHAMSHGAHATNLFAYVQNWPCLFVDPSGLFAVSIKPGSAFHVLCGGFKAELQIRVFPKDRRWPYPLMLIQRVRRESNIEICDLQPDCAKGDACNKVICTENCFCEFWEYFGTYENYADIFTDATDRVSSIPFSLPDKCPNTRGWMLQEHELRLIEATPEIEAKVANWRESVDCNGIEVGTTHATLDKPTFWENKSYQNGWYMSQVDWDCCSAASQCWLFAADSFDLTKFPPVPTEYKLEDCNPQRAPAGQEIKRPKCGGCDDVL